DRQPGRVPVRYQGKRLGNLAIDEAFIYPRFAGSMTQAEVLQTVAAMMNRSGFVEPATVTFRDGSTIRAIPTGVQVRTAGKVEIRFLDVATDTPRVVEADEVVNIQRSTP